jgi:hypothetical protein
LQEPSIVDLLRQRGEQDLMVQRPERKPRHTTYFDEVDAALLVTITRRKDPLDGQRVRVLGRLRRHGQVELLVVLPDGSKRMIPRGWTDIDDAK